MLFNLASALPFFLLVASVAAKSGGRSTRKGSVPAKQPVSNGAAPAPVSEPIGKGHGRGRGRGAREHGKREVDVMELKRSDTHYSNASPVARDHKNSGKGKANGKKGASSVNGLPNPHGAEARRKAAEELAARRRRQGNKSQGNKGQGKKVGAAAPAEPAAPAPEPAAAAPVAPAADTPQ